MVRRIYPSHVHFDQLFESVGTFGLWGGGDTRAQRESFPIYLIPTMGHFSGGFEHVIRYKPALRADRISAAFRHLSEIGSVRGQCEAAVVQ
jgi:hypothetical protein